MAIYYLMMSVSRLYLDYIIPKANESLPGDIIGKQTS